MVASSEFLDIKKSDFFSQWAIPFSRVGPFHRDDITEVKDAKSKTWVSTDRSKPESFEALLESVMNYSYTNVSSGFSYYNASGVRALPWAFFSYVNQYRQGKHDTFFGGLDAKNAPRLASNYWFNVRGLELYYQNVKENAFCKPPVKVEARTLVGIAYDWRFKDSPLRSRVAYNSKNGFWEYSLSAMCPIPYKVTDDITMTYGARVSAAHNSLNIDNVPRGISITVPKDWAPEEVGNIEGLLAFDTNKTRVILAASLNSFDLHVRRQLTASLTSAVSVVSKWRHTNPGMDIRAGVVYDVPKNTTCPLGSKLSQLNVEQLRVSSGTAGLHAQALIASPFASLPRLHFALSYSTSGKDIGNVGLGFTRK